MVRSIFTFRQQNIGVCISLALSMMTTAAKAGENLSTTQQPAPPHRHSISTEIRAYKPPQKRSAPTSPTSTTGRRGGCTEESKTSLMALAPHDHVGHTRSRRPTFSWYVPDARTFPMEFQLYQLSAVGSAQKILALPLQSTPGFMQVSLPAGQASLDVGQRYLWKVIQFCEGTSRPSSALITQAEIDVVGTPTTSVMTQLSNLLLPPVERAQIAAEQGLWYDAISTVLHLESPAALNLRTQLLQNADLEFEDTHLTKGHNDQSQQTEEITPPGAKD